MTYPYNPATPNQTNERENQNVNTEVMVPGILVALKTGVNGGVEYRRNTLESDGDGRVSKWETTRYIDDPDERKAAAELVGQASRLISKLCVRTSFGLLCRTDREAELDAAVAEARRLTTEWNRKARHSFIHVSAIKGRIADNDEEALRAIISEASDLLDRMDKGLADADITVIRDAANRAKRLSEMLGKDSSGQIEAAITAARKAARSIVKRGTALNDRVANAIIETERESFEAARFRFLDTVNEATDTVEALPSIDVRRAADLEFA